MKLTLQHTRPPNIPPTCGHCDDVIDIKEEYKYVKFRLGPARLDFHEDCFSKVLTAINRFSMIFIDERQGDPKGMIN